MKTFNLQEIRKVSEELKLEIVNHNENEISIKLTDNWILIFGNMFETDDGIELNDVPMLIMMKLLDGELLLIEQKIQRTDYKTDRYFDDKEGIKASLNCIEPGETFTIFRLTQT